MRVLIAAATPFEVASLVARFEPGVRDRSRVGLHSLGDHVIDVLETGVGMVATAAWCARTLAANRYDLALNLGVCGSFDETLPPGTVVHVTEDQLTELGAEDGERFLTLQDMGLTGPDETLFTNGRLVNATPPNNPVLARLPAVHGITVNTVHGNPRTIDDIVRRVRPQVESMEGAAFMYACLIHGVPFAQVRAVSNRVERRNRSAWKLPEAIANLADTAFQLLEEA